MTLQSVLDKSCRLTYTAKDETYCLPNKQNHSFGLVDGIVIFQCCATFINFYKPGKHMATYRHNKGIEKWRKEDIKIQETIHQLEQMQYYGSVVGHTLGNKNNNLHSTC